MFRGFSEFDPSGNWGSDSRWENTNYKDQTPNNTIVIRGLAQHISENDVSTLIARSLLRYVY